MLPVTSPATPQRRYGGKSADERAAERRAKLLSAALDVIVAKGAEAITVTGVCTSAGLSERYFYESFSDRNALLDALFDEISRQGAQAVLAATALPDRDRRERARALVAGLADILLQDPRLGDMGLRSRTDEAVMRGRSATAHHIAAAIEEHADRFWAVRGADPARVRARAVGAIGGIADMFVAWQADSGLSQPQLIEEATDFFVAAGTGLAARR